MQTFEIVSVGMNSLILAGAALLAAALLPVCRLIRQLPPGRLRARWSVMRGLIIFFIAGYAAYAIAFWHGYTEIFDLIVPAVFCLGAVFVWLVGTLAFETALNAGRIAELEAEAITDPLTGMFNRRHLERRIAEETARARRYALPLCLLLLDADRFKAVNDTHGHATGDRVLCRLARTLVESVRHPDIVGRYGGEEFAVVTPQTDLPAALELAERLRAQVALSAPPRSAASDPGRLPGITVSIGVARLEAGMADGHSLMAAADKALYDAKRMGRNCVVPAPAADAPQRAGQRS